VWEWDRKGREAVAEEEESVEKGFNTGVKEGRNKDK
jgi:hypothetical protein